MPKPKPNEKAARPSRPTQMLHRKDWIDLRSLVDKHEDAMKARTKGLADLCDTRAKDEYDWWPDRIEMGSGYADIPDKDGLYLDLKGQPCRRDRLTTSERESLITLCDTVTKTARALNKRLLDIAVAHSVPTKYIDIGTGEVKCPKPPDDKTDAAKS